MIEQRVRWGLLSTARINERLIPAIRQSDRSELIAVASRSQEKAKDYASKRNIPRAYGRYEDFLADADIDAVYISLPNAHHAEWSIKCADAGKHILCEKPIALTPEDVDRMADAAENNGVTLQEAAMYRFHPQTGKLIEMVAQGAIGDLRVIQGNFGFTLANRPDIRLNPSLGGGSLWDIGSYPVSFARAIMRAEPVEVIGWQVLGDDEVDLTFCGQMRFSVGTLAQFSSSFQTMPHSEAELIGSQGTIHLDLPWLNLLGETAHVRILRGGSTETDTFGDSRDDLAAETLTYENCQAYFNEVEAMVATILDGAPPTISLEDSRGNIATLVALYRSARENKMVKL